MVHGHSGSKKNCTIHLFSKHLPGVHHGPGTVPGIGAAAMAKQTSSLPPCDPHPVGEINLEQIITEVQWS